ncbi:hypothetical protein [Citromicrobium bathyomarinum]|uniref:hypothetical protein n=1 Tax=Citromicrobium bathyomarinum TaxID=72174 RepID=UPI00315A0323
MNLAKARWQSRDDTGKILEDCSTFAQGATLPECAELSQLMAGDAAVGFANEWLMAMVEACRADPLAQVPFRHSHSGGVGTIQLHRVGRVTLSLIAIEPQSDAPARSIAFTDCERHEIVLAGTGRGMAYAFEANGPLQGSMLPLRPGTRFCGDKDHSRAILALDTPLVVLRLVREPENPASTRQVDIATGKIVHRASASPAEGRAELAAALLGAMGRKDAAPALARYACGQTGEGARWQALRNALALDTRVGFGALCRIADRNDDTIADEAGALRDSLCTTYPQLAHLQDQLCLVN